MSARFRIRGADQMRRNIGRLTQQFPDIVMRALRAEAEIEMTEAKKRTPVDTGALRSSGVVEGPTRSGRTVTVTLAFGGPAAPYALQVHEDLNFIARVPGTGPKYLESTLLESLPHMANRLGRRIWRELAGVVG